MIFIPVVKVFPKRISLVFNFILVVSICLTIVLINFYFFTINCSTLISTEFNNNSIAIDIPLTTIDNNNIYMSLRSFHGLESCDYNNELKYKISGIDNYCYYTFNNTIMGGTIYYGSGLWQSFMGYNEIHTVDYPFIFNSNGSNDIQALLYLNLNTSQGNKQCIIDLTEPYPLQSNYQYFCDLYNYTGDYCYYEYYCGFYGIDYLTCFSDRETFTVRYLENRCSIERFTIINIYFDIIYLFENYKNLLNCDYSNFNNTLIQRCKNEMWDIFNNPENDIYFANIVCSEFGTLAKLGIILSYITILMKCYRYLILLFNLKYQWVPNNNNQTTASKEQS